MNNVPSDPSGAGAETPAPTEFDYLLNAFEAASQHERPASQDYGAKRQALFAYVRSLAARAFPCSVEPKCADCRWPGRDVVQRLVDATAHLMAAHDCDHHGWETTVAAHDAARAWLASSGSGESSEYRVGLDSDGLMPELIRRARAGSGERPEPSADAKRRSEDIDRFGFVRCRTCEGSGDLGGYGCARCDGTGREPDVPPASPNSGASGSTRGDDARAEVTAIFAPLLAAIRDMSRNSELEAKALAPLLARANALVDPLLPKCEDVRGILAGSPASGDAGSDPPEQTRWLIAYIGAAKWVSHVEQVRTRFGGVVTGQEFLNWQPMPTTDANEALAFARERDATSFLESIHFPWRGILQVEEHIWTDAGRVAGRVSRDGGTPPTASLVEAVAKAIYDAMRDHDPEGQQHPWVDRGNSLKQDEARSRAREALEPYRAAPSLSEEEREMLREIAKGIRVSFSSCAREVALLWRLAGPDTPPKEPISAAPTPEGTNG